MINRELIRTKVVQLVYAYVQNEDKSLDAAENELDFSLKKAYELYKYLLSLMVQVKRIADRREAARLAREERLGTTTDELLLDKYLAQNKLLQVMANNEVLVNYIEREKQEWLEEDALLKNIYKSFTESSIYHEYIHKGDFTIKADRELVRSLYKEFLLNNELLESTLEDHSIYWNDDKEVIEQFVIKTFSKFNCESQADMPLMPEFTEEADREFALQLFRQAIERGEEMRGHLRTNCLKWDFDRIALMDKVIIQTALAEILTFPEIPLNVSINEYVEIAKNYSTPKSGAFVNGQLDNICKRLNKERILMKISTKKKVTRTTGSVEE
ncbi:MAG: transcription antitermination factor NusB [Bacteroidaceae bacterium]|nr:transcription antitermination factor NusB [Bacteroidaceae bacterium]